MSADANIEAVYLNDKAQSENVITIFAKQIDSTRAGFYTEYDIDEKYTVIESGILMGPSDDLTFDSAPVKAAAQSKQNKGQFTARKKGLSLGDTYYAKGYVIYTDGENTYTIYSSAASCTIS
mgnify:FL=1